MLIAALILMFGGIALALFFGFKGMSNMGSLVKEGNIDNAFDKHLTSIKGLMVAAASFLSGLILLVVNFLV